MRPAERARGLLLGLLGIAPGLLVPALVAGAAGCTAGRVPDARSIADEYAAAVEHRDANALWAMCSESARRSLSREDVKRALDEQRDELLEQAKQLRSEGVKTEERARLRFADGEEVALELEKGAFRIASAGALPAGGVTPEEALDQLRRVLARRSYAGLLRVLTPATRAAVERDLRSLVEGLERPDTLPIQVTGDGAAASVPNGHHVRLRRESGWWRVEDFD
jgi:hypothetical protein